MDIKVDDRTLSVLKEELGEVDKDAARVDVIGFGWGGPVLGIVLDEQKEDDEVLEVGGVKFVADKDIEFLVKDASVIYKDGPDGREFSVLLPDSCGC